MAERLSIVFMGTPPFAATILQALLDGDWNVTSVYTQPDKPAGRGLAEKYSAVKELALARKIPIYQPPNFRESRDVAQLAEQGPAFLVVAAYGLILPQVVLDIPTLAPLNIHGSLLPVYRGAAPIQRAVMENWGPTAITGVSLMRIIQAMDAGPVYGSRAVAIGNHTWGTLAAELAEVGGELLLELLPGIASGRLKAVPQDEAEATYAPKLTRADGVIDWSKPALAVDAQIRGVTPWPGATTEIEYGAKSTKVTILEGKVGQLANVSAGTVSIEKKRLAIACNDFWYEPTLLKPEGRKAMTAEAFVNGLRQG